MQGLTENHILWRGLPVKRSLLLLLLLLLMNIARVYQRLQWKTKCELSARDGKWSNAVTFKGFWRPQNPWKSPPVWRRHWRRCARVSSHFLVCCSVPAGGPWHLSVIITWTPFPPSNIHFNKTSRITKITFWWKDKGMSLWVHILASKLASLFYFNF